MSRSLNRRCFVTTAMAAGLGLGLGLATAGAAEPAQFRAGTARKKITPVGPIYMSGYADRTKPSEGVLHDLWAKALAFENAQGQRFVIVTMDLVGITRPVTDKVAAGVKAKYGLDRGQLLLNAAHTHCGPEVWPVELPVEEIPAPARRRLVEYCRQLEDDLIEVVGAALADLSPATLEVGHGSAGFAVNRRVFVEGRYHIGVNPEGVVDHDVPVLKISMPDGKPRVVLFGYACHNTTYEGDCLKLNGDFAGFAQIEVEKAVPGATAMFMQLCAADQNPEPRVKPQYAEQHGKTLAAAVGRVLAGGLKPVNPELRFGYEDINLDFVYQDRSVYEKELHDENPFVVRRAKITMANLDAGRPIWLLPEPIQVVRLGETPALTILALGGEPVVDYSLRLKHEYRGAELIVAGYSNDVMAYIPSRRVLREGGYEADSSMIYYYYPGPLADNCEDLMIGACRRLLRGVGIEPEK